MSLLKPKKISSIIILGILVLANAIFFVIPNYALADNTCNPYIHFDINGTSSGTINVGVDQQVSLEGTVNNQDSPALDGSCLGHGFFSNSLKSFLVYFKVREHFYQLFPLFQ